MFKYCLQYVIRGYVLKLKQRQFKDESSLGGLSTLKAGPRVNF